MSCKIFAIPHLNVSRKGPREKCCIMRGWSAEEASSLLTTGSQLEPHTYFEYLRCDGKAQGKPEDARYADGESGITKLYLDRDKDLPDCCDRDVRPAADLVQGHHDAVVAKLDELRLYITKTWPGVDPASLQTRMAVRHGFVPSKGCWKLSFRPYLQGVRVRFDEVPVLLERAGQADFWDTSVYKTDDQALGCVFGCKGKGKDGVEDRRCLEPWVDGERLTLEAFVKEFGESTDAVFEYVAQHRDPAWPLLRMGDLPAVKAGRGGKAATTTRHGTKAAMEPGGLVPHNGAGTSIAGRTSASASNAGNTNTSTEKATQLLELISKTRWDDYVTWRNIATALKNHGGDAFKDEWKRFSRISSKYNEAEAEKLWASVGGTEYTGRPLTLGTIHHLAKTDDPDGYARYRERHVSAEALANWDKGDRGLAVIAHHLLQDVVKKTSKGVVYHFDTASCRWRKGDEDTIRHLVSNTVEEELHAVRMNYAAAAAATVSSNERETIDKHLAEVGKCIKYIRNHTGMYRVTSGMVQLCEDSTFERKLDGVRNILAVKNGVVELDSGELRNRRPEDMVLTVLDVEYDPQADMSAMEDFVRAAMADDEDMVRFLQKLLGYGITGEVNEEIFPVWTGSGRNGKGVLTQTLQKLMGPFFVEMNVAVICDRQVGNIEAERGKLQGARIAMFNELRPGEKLKTNEVQLLSGGDGIAAKQLYRDPITISPRHLCVLSTNHMPELSEVIPAMVERLLCIKFPVTFTNLLPGEEPTPTRRQADRDLKKRLESNLCGVLRWLVEGAVAWYAKPDLRRQAPESVVRHSREYFEEQDRLASFLAQRCEPGEGYMVPVGELYNAYTNWLGRNDDAKVTNKQFAASMRNKGYESEKKTVRRAQDRYYLGLRLRAVSQPQESSCEILF